MLQGLLGCNLFYLTRTVLLFTYTITFAVSYCIVAEVVLMALTCLMPVAELYKANYKFHNMFYGLLV